jgi:XTP/dITP diphosphohydrolase
MEDRRDMGKPGGASPSRRFARGARLVVASHNPGKVREILELVAPHGLEVVGAAELGLPEPEESGSTFAENAAIKATAAAAATGLPALADDSGLEVERLGGQPGIHSARWAGPDKDFAAAQERVDRELRNRGCSASSQRRANFTCALCVAWPDGRQETFEGRIYGHLVWPPRGTLGFGYDPMFVAEGETSTFGEMEPLRKHAISHRARAFALLAAACLGPARG